MNEIEWYLKHCSDEEKASILKQIERNSMNAFYGYLNRPPPQ